MARLYHLRLHVFQLGDILLKDRYRLLVKGRQISIPKCCRDVDRGGDGCLVLIWVFGCGSGSRSRIGFGIPSNDGRQELVISVANGDRASQCFDVFQPTRMSGPPCGVLPERIAMCLPHRQVVSSESASLELVFTDFDSENLGPPTCTALPILPF
ncbi:hypothetical protein EDD85DRAFT_167039 [Armillaria nabsnona]|nr:hypothetical protein EDD85DRAFT_167039 [Armillaria nabsnona]